MGRTRLASPIARLRAGWRTAAFALAAACACAFAQDLSEHQVKAAFLYNFTKFVQWPAESFPGPQAPVNLCIAGREALGGGIDALHGKPVQGRELRVRRSVRAEDLKTCHVLFVPDSKEAPAPELLRAARSSPVLTVGEADGFASSGGIVGFVLREERVHFEINPDAAARANLAISSQLLRLATIARDERRARP